MNLWDDEHGVVHQVINAGGNHGWFILCARGGPAKLHVNARRCKTVTCLWCASGLRGPSSIKELAR